MAINGRELIARRIAKELKSGDVVNLGIGLPTSVANYLPKDAGVIFQSENGFLGLGAAPSPEEADIDLSNAGGSPVTIIPGGVFFDSAMSFAIIRGGHVDVAVLGTLQVDSEGNIANYIIPGKMVPGMGGAMDLCCGVKKVIIAMDHLDKNGESKILEKCTLPLTAKKEANMIVTDLAVIDVLDSGLMVREMVEGMSKEELQAKTKAKLSFADNVALMQV